MFADDKRKVKEYETYKAKALAEKDAEAFRWLLNDHRGRWFLSKLADEGFVHQPTSTTDTNAICMREGRRTLVLDLHKQIRTLGISEELLLVRADGERRTWRSDIKESFSRKEKS